MSNLSASGPQVQPACGPICDNFPLHKSPTDTAIGTSCAIANSNLQTDLHNYANSVCGLSCQDTVTTTVACQASGSGFSVSGYITFGCRDSTC
jgi:hypothetical protein